MSKRPIGAVTFDLWDCLFCDETDEPKRAAAGELSKPLARRKLLHYFLCKHEAIEEADVNLAYNVTDAAFRKVWHEEFVTWSVAERLKLTLDGLGRSLPDDEFSALVDLHEAMEITHMPNPAPGARDALKALHGKYKLAIVSDAIFTPGRNLRKLLESAGMLHYFDHFVFSDEAGHSKPHPVMFQSVADAFHIEMDDIVHIGDRPHNDIGGPQAVGARGVLLTVVKQRPLDDYEPDATCDDYAKLPGILAELEG